MNTPDPDIMRKFMGTLEASYNDLGPVGCCDLIDHRLLSPDPLISELVFSMLVWESSIEHALRAVETIEAKLIDLNELRVCTPEELVSIFPARYPRSLERCQRLISILNTIFANENHLSLAHLREKSKREVVDYFSAIEGLPPFVSSRIILLGLGWHAFPIDEWLTKMLAKENITDPSLDIAQQTLRMERMVRATDALRYYTLIEHWASELRHTKTGANASKSKSTQANPTQKGAS